MYKYITRDYDNNNQDQIVLPGGNYRGIGLAFEGTNLPAQTLAIGDLGFLRLYAPNGSKLWDFSLDRMYGFVSRKSEGTQVFSSTVGAAISAFLYIPFHWNKDHNIVRLGSGYVLEYQHNTLSAITTTLNLTLMLQRGLGIQRYMPRYNDFNIRSLSAETTPDEFARKNLAMVAIVPTANISVIKFEKDNNLIYDMTDEQAEFVVNNEQVPEAYVTGNAPLTPWIIDLYKEVNLAEVLGSNYKFGCVSSDTTITGMTAEFDITEAALDTTSQVMASVKDKNAETPAEKTVA